MALGRELETGLDSVDTLGRWMGHYLAERMQALNDLDGEALAVASSEVSELILKIWERRTGAPFGKPPLQDLDAVQRVLARLDPGRPAWDYHGVFDETNEPSQSQISANVYLKHALDIDKMSGDLVVALVSRAVDAAHDDGQPWISHARNIADQSVRDTWLVRMLAVEEEGPRADPDVNLLRKLDAAIEMLNLLRGELFG